MQCPYLLRLYQQFLQCMAWDWFTVTSSLKTFSSMTKTKSTILKSLTLVLQATARQDRSCLCTVVHHVTWIPILSNKKSIWVRQLIYGQWVLSCIFWSLEVYPSGVRMNLNLLKQFAWLIYTFLGR